MTESGEHLETVRIVDDRDRLADVMSRAGESPEVLLGATYGWYWAADALAEFGASVHLAHPPGVKAFSYRRVKNDQLTELRSSFPEDARDAAYLADLLRMGRSPHAWIAPPETRKLRELVRHRAKLVSIRSQCKAQVHAVLAKGGIWVPPLTENQQSRLETNVCVEIGRLTQPFFDEGLYIPTTLLAPR